MKAVVQRVRDAKVVVAGETVGQIDFGLLVLVGWEQGDAVESTRRMAARLRSIRIFEDDAGKTNWNLEQAGGGILLVSQFTLAADMRRGNRPSFTPAMPPHEAQEQLALLTKELVDKGVRVESGRFGVAMEVAFTNLGPATYLLEM